MKIFSSSGTPLSKDLENLIASFPYDKRIRVLEVGPYGKGGYSGAKVYRVIPKGLPSAYIVKVGPRDAIKKEYDNFRKYVKGKLPCAIEPEFSDLSSKTSALREEMKDNLSGYIGLSEYFQKCDTFESVQKVLTPLFACLGDWYDLEKSSQATDIKNLFDRELKSNVPKWKSEYGEYRTVWSSELGFSIVNPFDIYMGVPSSHKRFLIGLRHGDLRFQNIFVSQRGHHPIAIDFTQTETGRILDDFVKLETSVKFELLECSNSEFWRLEEILSNQETYEELPATEEFLLKNSKLHLAFKTIENIRSKAKMYCEDDQINTYLHLLLLQSLKFLGYGWATREERERAHISAHLLAMKLTPTLANYFSPQISKHERKLTKEFDPYYDSSLRLLRSDTRALTIVQRTPTLLFEPESQSEREFKEELLSFIKKCVVEKRHFNYVFSAAESAAKYSKLNHMEKMRFDKNLKMLKALESKSIFAGEHHFRLECVGEDRKVFSPIIFTDNESTLFLAEDKSEPRTRKVISVDISWPTHLADLHDMVKNAVFPADVQSYSSIMNMLEAGVVDDLGYEILDKTFAMYDLGCRIADEAERRLIIIQRTPSLILGPEPIQNEEEEKNQYDCKFIEEMEKHVKRALEGRGFLFRYLFSDEMTKKRLDKLSRSQRNSKNNTFNSNIRSLKKQEDNSQKVIENKLNYTFRIAPISSSYLNPLALGDDTLAYMLGQFGTKSVVLKITSKRIADAVYQQITGEMPSPMTWDKIARAIGTLNSSYSPISLSRS